MLTEVGVKNTTIKLRGSVQQTLNKTIVRTPHRI